MTSVCVIEAASEPPKITGGTGKRARSRAKLVWGKKKSLRVYNFDFSKPKVASRAPRRTLDRTSNRRSASSCLGAEPGKRRSWGANFQSLKSIHKWC